MRSGVLALCPRLCRSLEKVEVGFGVRELFNLLDLQVAVFVGNDVCGPDHFSFHVHPDQGLRTGSKLLWCGGNVEKSDVYLNVFRIYEHE